MSGCREVTAPKWATKEYLAAYGVLLAGSDTAGVILHRGIEGSTSYETVLEAETWIVHGGNVTWLIRDNQHLPGCRRIPSPGLEQPKGERDCWAALLPEPAVPGETFTLHSVLSAGDSLRGEVRIPDYPQIKAPEPGERYIVAYRVEPAGAPLKTITMTLVPGAFSAQIEVYGSLARVWEGGSDVSLGLCETKIYAPPLSSPSGENIDLDAWFYGAACAENDVPIPWDSLDLRLTAVGYEKNYSDYLHTMAGGGEIARTSAGSGLNGAVGVFGAAALKDRVIRILLDETGSS
jgi:hypothetical protein